MTSRLTYDRGSIAVVACNPLESALFANPAEQRAPTREDQETTQALADRCRDAVRETAA